jgi:hypothetical protein
MSRSKWDVRFAIGLVALVAVVAVAAPAEAAVPDRKGWVLWNQTAGTTIAYGTWPIATAVTPLSVGRYQIQFPGQAVAGGIVHVTAINSSPHWCQAETWFPSGTDEIAIVRCYRLGGSLASTSFSAFFTSASGSPAPGPYGYVDSQPSGVIVSQYNSSGGLNTSTPGPPGQWTVSFPGIVTGVPLAGGLQATAVNNAVGARCKVAGWTSMSSGQNVTVYCFNSSGLPFNTRFTLTYQYKVSLYGATIPPQYHGYFLNQPPAGPPLTDFNSMLGPGFNTIMSTGPGLWMITFPGIGFAQNTVQVTAYGPSSDFCGLNMFWINTGAGPDTYVRNVNCFTSGGAPVNTGFLVTASSIQ